MTSRPAFRLVMAVLVSRLRIAALLSLCAFPGLGAQQPSVSVERMVGAWLGALKLEIPFRIVFRVQRSGDSLAAVADFPEQSARNVPLRARIEGDSLHLRLTQARIAFDGRIAPAGDSLIGTFVQGDQRFDLRMGRLTVTQETELSRPQEPKHPYPYLDQQVQLEGPDGVSLSGTLTRPSDTTMSYPAVLLVAGAGPLDRNATVAGHRTFLVLADRLTRAGYVVLRVDKRGVGRSTGSFATATTVDFSNDARAALTFLRRQAGVDPARVGMIGHSEGSLVVASVVAKDPSMAFAVLLAPPGVRGDVLMIERATAVFRARGVSEKAIVKDRRLRTALFAALLAPGDSATTAAAAHRAVSRALGYMSEHERHELGYDSASWDAGVDVFLAQLPWFRNWLRHDPVPSLRAMRGPVLALFGAVDQQVPPSVNAAPVRRALRGHSSPRSRVLVMPSVNHLMQTAISGSSAEYGRIPQTISDSVLEQLFDWLRVLQGAK